MERVERYARSHFLVIRLSRWGVALVLALALMLLLLPKGSILPASGGGFGMVQPGVTLLGRDFSGKTEAQARDMLEQMAGSLQSTAVPAAEVRHSDGVSFVIPELNGQTLDVETTLYRLKVAHQGEVVAPATRIQTPPKRLGDFPQSAIERGNPGKQAVGLLINVDWGEKELEKMLPMLKRQGVHATFFVSGRWAEKNKNLVRWMALDGHEIASHGYDLSTGPSALAEQGRLAEDIAKSVKVIEAASGTKVKYWAPHMSEVSPAILKTAASLGLRTVLYSLDTVDWRETTSPSMILGTIQKAKAGDLILLHPKPNTVEVLERAVTDLLAKGLKPMTLTEVIGPDPSR